MRCLYCGKEYWLPSQTKRDPDFCTPAHREQYNDRVERAMRLLQQSDAPPPVLKPVAEPLVQKPVLRVPSGETHSMPYGTPAATQPSFLSANLAPTPPVEESYEPAPAATAAEPSSTAPALSFEAPKADPFTSPVNPGGSPRRATLDRFEEKESARKYEGTAPRPREMFSVLETAPIDHRRARRLAITAIAASVGGVALLWVGAHAVRFGRNLLNLGATIATSSHAAADAAGRPDILPVTAPGRPGSRAFQHPLDWARSAAVRRATTHLAESFETGMTAWGAKPNDWAPGWSRSPDGFVHPGKLALFQPTLRYADYRIDFLGQIENRSLSWVVRGKDARNYYAMELKLARPGLRPVLSMTHYPVVDGIPGHPVEQPLSVMVHNDTPYHVSVEVEGTHYTVSIEGETIDSWSDDTLPAGGVGFFSEPGARARIYWLNVSRNDDWFGWFCGRIAGLSDPHENARLDIPVIPVPAPNPPALATHSTPDARTECEGMPLLS